MESTSIDLLPTALFSPSKAAQQRAQAQEWQQVDSWLSAKYQGRSVPQFERNDETLKVLIGLAAANEKADEERELLWAVQREALTEILAIKNREPSRAHALHNSLGAEGQLALDELAQTAIKLNVTDVDILALAAELSKHTQNSQVLGQQVLHLSQLQRLLEGELSTLRAYSQELKLPAFQPPLSLQRQTQEWNRNTRQLRAKLTEYSDRLAMLQAHQTDVAPASVHELVAKEQRVEQLGSSIKFLTAQVHAFKGLPKDKSAALEHIAALENQVSNSKQQLDAFFESLVGPQDV